MIYESKAQNARYKIVFKDTPHADRFFVLLTEVIEALKRGKFYETQSGEFINESGYRAVIESID